MATWTCILCNVQVTEKDHRREVDCPSKTCPGRVYHEDCIAGYLKRTKYSKDRCTGFPCPAILGTGKPCPGYVCKMHTFFPANPKKKQARLEAAVAAAALQKSRPAPVKSKTGAQVAVAAIKRPAPDGPPQVLGPVVLKPADVPGSASVNRKPIPLKPSAQEPKLIPGLVGPVQDVVNREALRAHVAKLKATMGSNGNGGSGAKNTTSSNIASKGVGSGVQTKSGTSGGKSGNTSEDDEAPRAPTTLWDAIVKTQGRGLTQAKYTRNSGGMFSTKLRKLLAGDATEIEFIEGHAADKDDGNSEYDSDVTDSSSRGVDDFGESTACGPLIGEYLLTLSPSQSVSVAKTPCSIESVRVPTASKDLDTGIISVEQDPEVVVEELEDPVVEYDVVYSLEDGTHVVLDAVSNAYYVIHEIYGPTCELVDCPAEDGQVYCCVAVRRSQLERRAQWQQTWLEMQVEDPSAPITLMASLPETQMIDSSAMWGAPNLPWLQACYGSPRATGVQERGGVPTNSVENDNTDVESLMQLLCV